MSRIFAYHFPATTTDFIFSHFLIREYCRFIHLMSRFFPTRIIVILLLNGMNCLRIFSFVCSLFFVIVVVVCFVGRIYVSFGLRWVYCHFKPNYRWFVLICAESFHGMPRGSGIVIANDVEAKEREREIKCAVYEFNESNYSHSSIAVYTITHTFVRPVLYLHEVNILESGSLKWIPTSSSSSSGKKWTNFSCQFTKWKTIRLQIIY